MTDLTRLLRRPSLAGLVLLLAASGAVAQSYVYVPSDTPSTGGLNAWPFSAHPNWRFQILVPASALPSAAFKISSVAFAAASTSTFSATEFQIRMAHTTLSTLDSVFDNNFDHPPIVCYDGPIVYNTTQDTWCPIGLTSKFGYDGVRNLVIEIRYRGGSSQSLLLHYGGTWRSYTHLGPDPYTATYRTGAGGGPKVRLNKILTGIVATPSTVSVGTFLPITVGNATPGHKYQILNAFGQGRIPLGGIHVLDLAFDPLLLTSLFGGAPTFSGYAGTVSSQQPVTGRLAVPNLSALAGVNLYSAAFFYDRQAVRGTTNTASTTLVP